MDEGPELEHLLTEVRIAAHDMNNALAFMKANVDFVVHHLPKVLEAIHDAELRATLAEMVDAMSDTHAGTERLHNSVLRLNGAMQPWNRRG